MTVTTSIAAGAGRQPARVARPGALTSVVARHSLLFLVATVVAYLLPAQLPAGDAPVVWLAAAALLGVAAALVARAWLGLLFMLLGLSLGLLLELHLRVGAGSPALDELTGNGFVYLSAAVVLIVAYAAGLAGRLILRGRR